MVKNHSFLNERVKLYFIKKEFPEGLGSNPWIFSRTILLYSINKDHIHVVYSTESVKLT